jgi:hypothetical protein
MAGRVKDVLDYTGLFGGVGTTVAHLSLPEVSGIQAAVPKNHTWPLHPTAWSPHLGLILHLEAWAADWGYY